ncbi:flagellar hook protein FlgE [Methylocella sp.]|uniref:flagellar hook protein FlgE n=1 Tax=Methylocella sp. TaxID=1978226 RepID=UPI003782DDB5
MSLLTALNASVSGMNAQSVKLATVSDNIANADTTGYKQAETEFMSLLNQRGRWSYEASGVTTRVRYDISEQGALQSASSTTDLAVQGSGYFLVSDSSGAIFLTRAGDFQPDAKGNLVNSAGFTLMGYSAASGATGDSGLAALEPVNVAGEGLKAVPSTTGTLKVNLNASATAISGSPPSANVAGSVYTSKTSMVTYDNLGAAKTLDVYYAKTGANTWEMSVYDASAASSGGGFPYSSAALSTQTLAFSAADGSLTTTPATTILTVPGGQSLTLDLSGSTQLATDFSAKPSTNGGAPSAIQSVAIGTNGALSYVYANGAQKVAYTIPLGTVTSPDNLTPLTGDVFAQNQYSGEIAVGEAGSNGFGSIQSQQLEASTVDLATQLTDMIVAQRAYESNSKVFQTGSELLQQLNNMLK